MELSIPQGVQGEDIVRLPFQKLWHEGEWGRRFIAILAGALTEIDGAPDEAAGGACLEAADLETEVL